MTVYKAFRNFIIALAIVGIIVTGSLIGFSAYKIYDYTQNSQYVVSKLGSSGSEVKKIQQKLKTRGVAALRLGKRHHAAFPDSIPRFDENR